MPETPNTSFIPRQGPVHHTRQTGSRQIRLLSVFSYGAFIIALAITASSFFYERHIEKQLSVKVEELDQAIAGFNEADMNQVKEFNTRLAQVRGRLENGVSIAAIFEALEDATLESVTFDTLTLERNGDAGVSLDVAMMTNSFDSSLFQRGVLERTSVIDSIVIEDLALEGGDETTQAGVSFLAKINIPTSAVPNKPNGVTTPAVDSNAAPINQPITGSSSASVVIPPVVVSGLEDGAGRPVLEDNQPSL
jgi:hypothetical protein